MPVVWPNFRIYSGRSKLFSVAIGDHGQNLVTSLWLEDKAKISGEGASWLTPPQKFRSARIRWKRSCLDFLGSRGYLPHWLYFKGLNYQRRILLTSAGATEGHFELKPQAARKSTRGSCTCTTNPRLTGHLQPRRNWLTWVSNFLITHPILCIWPRWTTTCSLDWKINWKSPFFVRRGVHCCRDTWFFFWFVCNSQNNGLRSILRFVGSTLNKSQVCSLCLLPSC